MQVALTWLLIGAIIVGVLIFAKKPEPDTRTEESAFPPMIDRDRMIARAAAAAVGGDATANVPKPKRGAAIFENADSPRTWDAYIGQTKAKRALMLAIKSAEFRKARLPHVLIASGSPGVGKSALARLIGAQMGVGVTEITGEMNQDRARAVIGVMKSGDILVWDEFHQALNAGKRHAEWLLTFLQEGTLMGPEGLVKMPAVTVVAATTDKGCIPEPILSRFGVIPELEAYTEAEYHQIARNASVGFFESVGLAPLTDSTLIEVTAASKSPRLMKHLLANLRDCEIGGVAERNAEGDLDLSDTLDLMGLTRDGLDSDSISYLLALFSSDKPIGIRHLMSQLGMADIPILVEAELNRRGYLSVSRDGRQITAEGRERVKEYLIEQGALTAE